MSGNLYKSLKNNTLWDVDFRTGSFKDRSSNVEFKKYNGSLNNVGFPGGVNAYVLSNPAPVGNITEFTVLTSIKYNKASGETERILQGIWNLYFTAGRGALALGIGSLFETFGLSALQIANLKDIAVTAKNGIVNYYFNGLFVGSDDYTPDTFALGSFNINGNTSNNPIAGTHLYNIAYDKALSATEISILTSELEQVPDQRVSSKAIASEYPQDINAANEIADGDMEAAGVTAWIAGNSAVLSKQPNGLFNSYRILRIYRAANFGTAYQNVLTIGLTYRVRGYTRSDGISTGSVFVGTVTGFTSTISTDWQYFDFISTANQVFFQLKKNSLVDSYVEFDHVSVQEVGKTYLKLLFKGELAAIANEATISSGFLENLDARIISGSFKVTTTKVNGLLRKNIVCVTNGSLYFNKMNSSVSGVSRYIDGVHVTTDLAAARTISLTAGQVLIYASEDERLSLYQEA